MRRHASGFTLLEMLVVLVLVSLIAGLLTQVFAYVLQLRGRFLVVLEEQRVEILQQQWFHGVISNVISLPSTADEVFGGNETGLHGLTLGGLDADVGIPTFFNLQLDEHGDETHLRYKEVDGVDWTLARWSNLGEGFRYLDAKGEWYAQWPYDGLNPMEQLPVAVRISWSDRGRERIWIVRLKNDRRTKRDLQQLGAG